MTRGPTVERACRRRPGDGSTPVTAMISLVDTTPRGWGAAASFAPTSPVRHVNGRRSRVRSPRSGDARRGRRGARPRLSIHVPRGMRRTRRGARAEGDEIPLPPERAYRQSYDEPASVAAGGSRSMERLWLGLQDRHGLQDTKKQRMSARPLEAGMPCGRPGCRRAVPPGIGHNHTWPREAGARRAVSRRDAAVGAAWRARRARHAFMEAQEW